MTVEQIGTLYDRLLGIKMTIESQPVPNPRYINEKIGECRRYIEEVEKFMFQVSKEMSIVQQALNNSTAEYESKKESLLTKDETIKSLPSIKDREAKSNSLLKEEIDRIRGYQNESTNLNNLLRAINLKMKNLNGANSDIKMQLRIMESQIKLNSGPEADVAMNSLMAEMSKSRINKDMFEGIHTTAEETQTEDPTQPLNLPAMLRENIIKTEPEPEEEPEEEIEEVPEIEGPSWTSFNEPVKWDPLTETDGPSNILDGEPEKDFLVVDLDTVIEINYETKPVENKGGIKPEPKPDASQKEIISQVTITNPAPPKNVEVGIETQKAKTDKIDIDDLLNSLTK